MPQTSLREERLFLTMFNNKVLQVLLLLLILSSVVLFYLFAGSNESFLSETKALKDTDRAVKEKRADTAQIDQAIRHAEEFKNDYHILFMFTKASENPGLHKKLKTALDSMFQHAKFDSQEILHLHFVSDEKSKVIAEDELIHHQQHPNVHLQIHFHNADDFARKVHPIVEKMQEHFGNHNYFKDAIFFLSIAMHRIMPSSVHRIVQLDLDLRIDANIRDLWDEFSYFAHTSLYGLAREDQPVYRHLFWKHRKDNPGTKVGSPPPDGFPGFNSGVVLLNLDRIRDSKFYNDFLDEGKIEGLVKKYHFKGHLGDQDFFTLMSMDHPELFYYLDCVWNRQLCQWWKGKGYDDIFDKYFVCNGDIKIWHGNCNTPFPDEE